MKNLLEIASELSKKLSTFGTDQKSIEVIEQATAANSWFTEDEIRSSIEAISTQMLDTQKLKLWAESYPTLPHSPAHNIAIIMAGNIPLVGFFDLLCTIAAGDNAWIKPSSKDKVLIEYIIALLKEVEPSIPIYIYNENQVYDAIIATGGEEANKYFEAKFKGIKRLCRNNRFSVAVLSGNETKEEMELLANDIYLYSGLGCRNVSMIIRPKGSAVEIPAMETNPKYRNNYLQTRALLAIRGKEFIDNGSSTIVESQQAPETLSSISTWEYDSIEQVKKWIEEHEDKLQCIVSQIIDHPRAVNFGQTQSPTLFDYADGVDTMKFLDF